METHDHQSSVDAAMPQPHEPSAAPTENMTPRGSDTASVSPEPAAQAMPGRPPENQTQAASIDPSARTAIPDQQTQTVSQSPQTAGQQAQFQPYVIMDPGTGQLYYAMPQGPPVQPQPQNGQYAYFAAQAASADASARTAMPGQQGQAASQSPQAQTAGQQVQFQPNVIMDPGSGQLYYAMPQGPPVHPQPQNGQYVPYYTAQVPPEQRPEPHQPDYAQIIKSVEDFAEGDASVADVVKTLWTETSQDDQFWKGAVVGAVTAALLTSETVRGAMGKTFGTLFGKNTADAAAPSSPAPDVNTDTK